MLFHFLIDDHYSKIGRTFNDSMELSNVSEQKANLSFSIENILREDFPSSRRVSRFSKPVTYGSRFQRWPYTPVFYAVRYSPVVMQLLPNIQDSTRPPASTKANIERVTSSQSLLETHRNLPLKSIHEPSQRKEDEISTKDVKQEKCAAENGAKRKRRSRSHFTQRQLQYLESIFSRQQYLTRDERTLLARGLEMTELQVRNWFQNRRYQKKNRAMDKAEQDQPDSSASVKGKAC